MIEDSNVAGRDPVRRKFLKGIVGVVASAAIAGSGTELVARKSYGKMSSENSGTTHPLSTNVYPWMTFYLREGKEFEADFPKSIAEVRQSGVNYYESNLKSLEFVYTLSDELEKQGVGIQSVYVNSDLWEEEKAKLIH